MSISADLEALKAKWESVKQDASALEAQVAAKTAELTSASTHANILSQIEAAADKYGVAAKTEISALVSKAKSLLNI